MTPTNDPIPPRPTATAASGYAAVLAEQLRQSGMREERVRVVVADVLDHVHATGEDPVEAFGQPADYAAQWAPPLGPGPIVLRILAGGPGGGRLLRGPLRPPGRWRLDGCRAHQGE